MKFRSTMSKRKSKIANEMIPGDIFHPGEHLKDEIEARGMSQQQLALDTKLSKSEISLIIHGRRNITPLIALKIEMALGVNAEFWMNLQIKYEIDQLKRKYQESLSKMKLNPSKKAKMGKFIAAA
jgi:addiction module HigA family antidote